MTTLKNVEESNGDTTSNWCKERSPFIGTEQEDIFTLVDVHLFSTVTLACHYCDEYDDENPKVWFKRTRKSQDMEKELNISFSDKLSDNRVFILPDHTLVIQNISELDNGIYFCHGLLGEGSNFNFNYIIDVLNKRNEEINKNNTKITVSEKILYSTIDKINLQFRVSNESDYKKLRDKGILMKVVSSWTTWEPCNGCLKIKKRKQKCVVKPILACQNGIVTSEERCNNINQTLINDDVVKVKTYYYYNFACRSLQLSKIYPRVAKALEKIPEYSLTEQCFAPCYKFKNKDDEPKYENILTLEQGSSATFVCPESTYNDQVIWKKDRSTIETLRRDPHLQVDMFATLYLRTVTENQSGNYTCYINNKPIQRINVVVKTKSIFLTEDFQYHCQFLAIIFVICFFFYITGVISACAQKKRFKAVTIRRRKLFMKK